MSKRNMLIGASVMALFLAVYLRSTVGTQAATKTINILGSQFSPTTWSNTTGDTVVWANKDLDSHKLTVRYATNSAVIINETLGPLPVGTGGGNTRQHTFNANEVAAFEYLVDDNENTKGTLTVTAAIASPSVSPSMSATPTASAIATPVATASPTGSPTASPTSVPSPSPTVAPTMTATPAPTMTATPVPTATPTVAPTATATPTIAPTATPTMQPTASPTAIPTATASPIAQPTLTPTGTPVASASPTPTPVPTPTGEVLPAFSIFRKTSCSSAFMSNDSFVQTDKLNSVYLVRGHWEVKNFTSVGNQFKLGLHLSSIRKVNLFFGGNPFFNGDVTYSADQTVELNSNSISGLLSTASNNWCASQ